jgi:tetratricopeptide (TPR) repeat protein
LLLSSFLLAPPALAQEPSPALPPPVTRSLYRAHWFEFLNAHLEDDARSASVALAAMQKAARKAGVRRLSDFSRSALHEARRAEALGKSERASRAFEAARLLDDANYDALVSKIGFLLRRGEYVPALSLLTRAPAVLLATRESRLALASALGVWAAFAAAAAVLAWFVALFLRHRLRVGHDIREMANRLFGDRGAAPLGLAVLGLPLLLGMGPLWLLLYWGALLHAYAGGRERRILEGSLIVLGLAAPLLVWLARENVLRRSPLFVAAVDLAEEREDASAEDGLRQAAAIFAEDPDVWYLLGLYAERSGDIARAHLLYGRALQADPRDFRSFLQRGNLLFLEGDYAQAILAYDEAIQRAPGRAEAYYNLSIARGEAYDFAGQAGAIARARAVAAREVNGWAANPTLSRVVSAGYPIRRARARIERWNAQPKSRRLPGHAAGLRPERALLSAFTLAPWGALFLGLALTAYRSRRGLASQCARCGAPFCRRCKRPGDPALYCTLCVRLHLLKEEVGIGAHVEQAQGIRRRALWGQRARLLASLLFPGSDRLLSERPAAALLFLLGFFFALGVALIDGKLFSPRPLASRVGFGVGQMLALGVALVVWLIANLSSRRVSRGS